MASVYIVARDTLRGRSFQVKYRLHGRYGKIRHAGAFPTRKEATLRASKVREWIAEARDPAVELARFVGPGVTVPDLAGEWLSTKRRVRASTLDEYRRRVDRIARDFGTVSASRLTGADVNAWVDRMLQVERLRPSTVTEYVRVLRSVLELLDGDNVARDRRVELPRQERRVLEPPDADTVLRVLTAVNATHRSALILIEQTGLRASEACAVRPEHHDRTASRLLVPVTKTGAPRWVPLSSWLNELVNPPWQVTRQTLHHALRRACVGLGVSPFGPHMLRHRRASLWSAQHVAPAQAAAWLGHSVETYLRLYTHVIAGNEIPAQALASLLSHASTSSRST